MRNSSMILKQLKSCYYSLFDSNGNKRVELIGELKNVKLSSVRLEILYDIFKILLDTDMICDYTKAYIKNRDIKVQSIVEDFNSKGDNVTLKQVNNKIQYDKRKIESAFGSCIITVIVYTTTSSIDSYVKVVDELYNEYFKREDLRDKLAVKLDKDILNSERVNDFRKRYEKDILGILKARIMLYELQLNEDKEFLGYFNYLLSKQSLTNEDELVQKDREWLLSLLNCDIDKLRSIYKKKNTVNKKLKVKEKLKDKENSNAELLKEEIYTENENVEDNLSSNLVENINNNDFDLRENNVVNDTVKENLDNENDIIDTDDFDLDNEDFDFDTVPIEESNLENNKLQEEKNQAEKDKEVTEFFNSLDTKKELKDNKKELKDNKKELSNSREKLSDNKGKLNDNKENKATIKTTRIQF